MFIFYLFLIAPCFLVYVCLFIPINSSTSFLLSCSFFFGDFSCCFFFSTKSITLFRIFTPNYPLGSRLRASSKPLKTYTETVCNEHKKTIQPRCRTAFVIKLLDRAVLLEILSGCFRNPKGWRSESYPPRRPASHFTLANFLNSKVRRNGFFGSIGSI
jgi:hypothetical protein